MNAQFAYDPDIGYRFVPHLKTRVATDDGGYPACEIEHTLGHRITRMK